MLAPGLSMLWESADPDVVLTERFGFDDLDAAGDWLAAALQAHWSIVVGRPRRLTISDHNAIVWVPSDRGDLVVKWSHAQDRFDGLDASTALLQPLAAAGVPVATPYAALDGRVRVTLPGPAGPLSVAVLPELDGDWLDTADDAAVHAAGACLAQVHLALAGLDLGAAPPFTPLAARVATWLGTADHGRVPRASRRLERLLARAPRLDDRPQLVHNDYRAANILVRDAHVVGVLDLDEVLSDHRVVDLAKASVYLGTRFTDWRPTPPAVRRRLRDGYESVRPLSGAESAWWEVAVLWHGLQVVPAMADPDAWAAALG